MKDPSNPQQPERQAGAFYKSMFCSLTSVSLSVGGERVPATGHDTRNSLGQRDTVE